MCFGEKIWCSLRAGCVNIYFKVIKENRRQAGAIVKNIIRNSQTICPVCGRAIDAAYEQEGEKVYYVSRCPEHGTFRTTAAEDAGDFRSWIESPVINVPPRVSMTKGDPDDKSCPLHCGLCENHLQTACCVLIEITDRCDQHCPYCFASSGDGDRSREPSLEEIKDKYDLLLELGEERPFNIQISGGEPAVRDDLPEIIRAGREKGFEYIQLNSNGRRIGEEPGYAQELKDAGCSVVFMQFDGTHDRIYRALRGEDLLETKKKAIRNCEKAGLPVTLVPTVAEGINTDDLGEMMDFLMENVNVVKGIHFQPVSFFGRHPEKIQGRENRWGNENIAVSGDFPGRITMFGLLRKLEEQRPAFRYEDFSPISTGHPLCCFYSTYIKEPDGSARCTLTAERKKEGISCCDTIHGTADRKMQAEVVKKDRDFVLNKWEVASPEENEKLAEIEKRYGSSLEITSFDDFLGYYKRNAFTVTGMAFQDMTNLDGERVKRCRVQVLSDDDRLIPFCAYNSIYRDREKMEEGKPDRGGAGNGKNT